MDGCECGRESELGPVADAAVDDSSTTTPCKFFASFFLGKTVKKL
jgi:hypothetical protein